MSTDMVECARKYALFVSAVQPSDAPAADDIRAAVTGAVRRYGTRGCVALVAHEFGEHPEVAAARMRWASATVAATFLRAVPRPVRREPTLRVPALRKPALSEPELREPVLLRAA
jgi:hypothetical protein